MTEREILEHCSKRNYIETYFKEVKQNFGLKPQVFSAKSTERHVELVQLAFTVWILARFYRSVKDQIGLRDFPEKLRLNYYLWLAPKMIETGYQAIPHPFEFLVNSKCITRDMVRENKLLNISTLFEVYFQIYIGGVSYEK